MSCFSLFPSFVAVVGCTIVVSSTTLWLLLLLQDDQAVHLLFSANRWECSSDLIKQLEMGNTLICDRYAYSGIAYSGSKGLNLDWCKAPDIGLPAPDLVIFLDLPVDDAKERGEFGEERYEKVDMQRKVAANFKLLQTDSWKVGHVFCCSMFLLQSHPACFAFCYCIHFFFYLSHLPRFYSSLVS